MANNYLVNNFLFLRVNQIQSINCTIITNLELIQVEMNNFASQISPISSKNVRFTFGEDNEYKIDSKQISNISHFFKAEHLYQNLFQKKAISAAKTIVYLFSPDIDLLEHIEHDISNYDKFQKTKNILMELIRNVEGSNLEIQNQVLRTSEEIERLRLGIEELSMGFEQLQIQNVEKDRQIQKYKGIIIELAKAYEEAKICYEDEILELKYELQEFKHQLTPQKHNKSRSKSQKQKSVKIQSKLKQTEIEAYTDQSIYKRFTSNHEISEQILKSLDREPQKQQSAVHFSKINRYAIDKYEYEKQQLQIKIIKLEQCIKRQAKTLQEREQEYSIHLKEIKSQLASCQKDIQQKSKRIKEKNKIISQLLDSLQKK